MFREFLFVKGLLPAVSLQKTVDYLRVYLWREGLEQCCPLLPVQSNYVIFLAALVP